MSHATATSKEESLWFLLKLATPMIVIQLTVTVMQFADAFMVAPLGKNALAAVLPAGLFYLLPIGSASGLLSCINTFVSQSLGRSERTRCGYYAWQGIFIAIVLGVLIVGLFPVSRMLFAALGHSPAVQKLESIYFSISLFGAIPALVVIACSNFFVGIHKPHILVFYSLAATLLNIPFNYILIYGKFGLPAFGLAGSAMGTVLAVFCQAIGIFLHFLLPMYAREYGTRKPKFDWKAIRMLLRIGIPAGIQLAFEIFSWSVALVWLVGFFGTDHLAATTIVVRWLHLSFMPSLGFVITLMAVVGRAIGEGNPELANRQTHRVLRATMIYMGCVGLTFLIFRAHLIAFFTDSPHIIAIGSQIMVLVAIFQIFDAAQMVFIHALRGAGDATWPAVTSSTLCVTLFLCGGYAVVKFFPQLQSLGPWGMATIYMITLGCIMTFRWKYGPWRKKYIFQA